MAMCLRLFAVAFRRPVCDFKILAPRLLHVTSIRPCVASSSDKLVQIETEIFKAIGEIDPNASVQAELTTDFSKDLGFDSFRLVDLIVMMEDKFNVEIPTEDIDRFRCPKDVVDYIANKLHVTRS